MAFGRRESGGFGGVLGLPQLFDLGKVLGGLRANGGTGFASRFEELFRKAGSPALPTVAAPTVVVAPIPTPETVPPDFEFSIDLGEGRRLPDVSAALALSPFLSAVDPGGGSRIPDPTDPTGGGQQQPQPTARDRAVIFLVQLLAFLFGEGFGGGFGGGRDGRDSGGTVVTGGPITVNVPVTLPAGGGGGGGGGGFGRMSIVETSLVSGLGGLVEAAAPLLERFFPRSLEERAGQPTLTLPGGATMTPTLFDIPGLDIVSQGAGALTEPFRRTPAGSTAQAHVRVSPEGRQEWFRPAGRPVLFSKDMGICRKVERLAKRAARTTTRRRSPR